MIIEEKITPDNGGEITLSIGDFTNRLLIEMKGVQLEMLEAEELIDILEKYKRRMFLNRTTNVKATIPNE